MQQTSKRYWLAQVMGWSIYPSLIVAWNLMNGDLHMEVLKAVSSVFVIGVLVSHLFRSIVIKFNWLSMGIAKSLPRALITSMLMGVVAFVLQVLVNDLFFRQIEPLMDGSGEYWASLIFNWTILFMLWSFAYFAYHYFVQHQREEIENLRLSSAMRESELSNLRSQLNPHFMFNALNSIRALVDENPQQAKEAILQLSNILRTSLSIGRKETIPLEDELEVVRAYLALESVRYEERLRVSINVDNGLEKASIPPMMIQTLVENAVKHGISKLTAGGELGLRIVRVGDSLSIQVNNSGHYDPNQRNGTGIGLINTRKRLELMFGKNTELTIKNENDNVVTRVTLPYRTHHESITDR